jgi:hypothetical protein
MINPSTSASSSRSDSSRTRGEGGDGIGTTRGGTGAVGRGLDGCRVAGRWPRVV